MKKRLLTSLLALMIILSSATAFADGPGDAHKSHDGEPADRSSVTQGEVSVAGQALKYQATAGTLLIKDDAGKPKAEMFYVAYEKAPVQASRPVTFVFNGGPGAAAVWLHLGTAGPKRVALDEQGIAPPPPYHLEDNPNTWLAATDLVFIDPVGTGYSRAVPGEDPKQFYGVNEDVAAVGAFIRLYITRNSRWGSPLFLAGESYGTTRAAALSQYLLESDGISLNGIILISSVLNFRTLESSGGNELPFVLYLPSYTSIARHFHKLPDDLQQADPQSTLAEVEQWATHDYLNALVAGSALPVEDRKTVAAKLARYTGLPESYVLKSNLRIDAGGFRSELLANEKKVLGRFDARIAGHNPDTLSESADYDPSLPPYFSAYTSTFNEYCRNTLKYETDRSYDVLTGRVHPWNFGPAGSGYLDVASDLQDAMIKNPHMRVMFCNGSQDLATPYLAARYTINHLNLSDDLRGNITHRIYDGGHMIYHVRASQAKLGADIGAFIHQATPATTQPIDQTAEHGVPATQTTDVRSTAIPQPITH